jgi:hypothetical protein
MRVLVRKDGREAAEVVMATDGSYQPTPFPLKGDWRLVAKSFPIFVSRRRVRQ